MDPGRRAGARGRAAPRMRRRALDAAPRPGCAAAPPAGLRFRAPRTVPTRGPGEADGYSRQEPWFFTRTGLQDHLRNFKNTNVRDPTLPTYTRTCVRTQARAHTHTHTHTLIRNSDGVLSRQWDIVAARSPLGLPSLFKVYFGE